MNSSTKVFSILSLSTAIGGILANAKVPERPGSEKEKINWRGQKLKDAGFKATGAYPFPPLTTSKMRQIQRKISEVCRTDEEFNIVETLAFLLAGLVDIRAHVKPEKWAYLDPVFTRAKWCLELFDSRYEFEEVHAKAWFKYSSWAA